VRVVFRACLLVLAASVAGCSGSTSTPTAPTSGTSTTAPVRVLMLTTTFGFRHDSIPTARQAMASLASRSGVFTVTATEDLNEISAARLASLDVLMFALTTGELPLSDGQKSAVIDFMNNGGGFIGVHSATDTLYQWSDYGRLVGAYFKEHPWTQSAVVTVENAAHPTMAGVDRRITILEEFYTFQNNPRPSVDVLLTLDPASVAAQGDFPLAWAHAVGRGRAYYNALGHFSETWNDARFQTMMLNAIKWTAQR
jgi:type 1 glutamine amidotransferase